MPSIIEYLREQSISRLFSTKSFNSAWPNWKPQIQRSIGRPKTATNVLGLGDLLSTIFSSTATARTQATVSGGGVAWECLVCWYLNLCLVGSRTIVIKQNRLLMPTAISDALTVNYGNFASNTESDLIAITFPDAPEFFQDIMNLNVKKNGAMIPVTKRGRFNYKEIIDQLAEDYFDRIGVCLIQCKTNWNDNAQIPMLWDIVYSSQGFTRQNITLGSQNFSIRNLASFSYAFMTVPTSGTPASYTSMSTPVRRVAQLSGGNYWGHPSSQGVASSIKEIFTRILNRGATVNLRTDLQNSLNSWTAHSYFDI